jgi:ABC-type transporter lipoprotein component MlaA
VDNSAQATSPNTNTPPTGDTSSDNTGLQAEESDPLEPFNSAMFTFNLKVDDYVLHPAASGYAKVIPQGGREAVGARSTT